MLAQTTTDRYSVLAVGLGVLDVARSLYCPWCGQMAKDSLANAANEGWNDFEEDFGGRYICATCPRCADPRGN